MLSYTECYQVHPKQIRNGSGSFFSIPLRFSRDKKPEQVLSGKDLHAEIGNCCWRAIFYPPPSGASASRCHRLRMVCFGLRRQSWGSPVFEDYYLKFNDAGFLWRLSRGLIRRLRRYIFQYSGGSLGGITTGWVGMFRKEA